MGASGVVAGDAQKRSTRFNDDDSAYLNRTPSSAGNRKTWTWSGWVKRGNISGTSMGLFSQDSNCYFRFSDDNGGDSFRFVENGNDNMISEQVFRDPSAWYHIVVAVDSTQGTESNRFKVYINNEQITTWQTSDYPGLNHDFDINSAAPHQIARCQSSTYFDGYLADIHFCDGLQLDATSFGEADATTGQWIPKEYTGSYGTNGFHLAMDPAQSNPFGDDSSGNGNDWTANNLVATVGGTVYSDNLSLSAGTWGNGVGPEKAFNGAVDNSTNMAQRGDAAGGTITWTFSGLSGSCRVWIGNAGGTVTDGNGTARGNNVGSGQSWITCSGDISDYNGSIVISVSSDAPSLGAVEVAGSILTDGSHAYDLDLLADVPGAPYDNELNGGGNYCTLNPLDSELSTATNNGNLNTGTAGTSAWELIKGTMGVSSGKWYWEGIVEGGTTSGSDGYQFGVMLASLPPTDGPYATGCYSSQSTKLYQASNETTITDATLTTNAWALDLDNNTLKFYRAGVLAHTYTSVPAGTYTPFGGSYGSSLSVTFNFGQRAFAYTPPTGFKALNAYNLPAPTIVDPSDNFQARTRIGGGTTQNFTTLKPGLVWQKDRTDAGNYYIYDVVRGDNKYLDSQSTAVENTGTGAMAFSTNSYTVANSFDWPNTKNIIDWVWNTGTANVTNDASATGIGTTDSTYRANPSAGFSSVSYTGIEGGSVAHGLGAKPDFLVVKNLEASTDWCVWHKSMPNTKYLKLNSNAAINTWNVWGDTDPTTSLFTVSGDSYTGNLNDDYIAYAWSEVAGYSKFGSWVSTGADFVYLGFKPAFLLAKCTSNPGDWMIYDTKRSPDNQAADSNTLVANVNNAEDGYYNANQAAVDLLSNGFKIRHSGSSPLGDSGRTYIYCAWAESPFKYSNAR